MVRQRTREPSGVTPPTILQAREKAARPRAMTTTPLFACHHQGITKTARNVENVRAVSPLLLFGHRDVLSSALLSGVISVHAGAHERVHRRYYAKWASGFGEGLIVAAEVVTGDVVTESVGGWLLPDEHRAAASIHAAVVVLATVPSPGLHRNRRPD